MILCCYIDVSSPPVPPHTHTHTFITLFHSTYTHTCTPKPTLWLDLYPFSHVNGSRPHIQRCFKSHCEVLMIHKCFLSFLLMLLHHKSPRVSRPQQPTPHTHIHTLTHTNHDCPLSGIRASFWWLILASWHQSSIPQLPCKTLSLTTHFTSKTTANALVHNMTA